MKDRLNILLMIASGGMMLSWLHSWESFIMPSITGTPIPVSAAGAVLAVSALITAAHHLRGWRRIFIALFHSAGFILSLSIILYIKYNSPGRISALLNNDNSVLAWMEFISTVFFTVFIWFYGIRLAVIPNTRTCINKRFDIGLASFLVLLLIKLTMRYKDFIPSYEHSTMLYFISFCILGLFSMGLVRMGKTSSISYYKGIGTAASFILFVVFAGGLTMLFLPGLASGADTGYELLKTGARPVGRILQFILRIIFSAGCNRSSVEDSSSSSGKEESVMAVPDVEPGIFEIILLWALSVIAGLLILPALLAGTRLFFRWLLRILLSRTPGTKEKNLRELILELIAAFKKRLLYIISRIFGKTAKEKAEEHLYRRLQVWGSRSGLAHVPHETPGEYGARLARFFPICTEDIDIIVDLFSRSVYGCIYPDDRHLYIASRSWKKLRSPVLWPARIKVLFFSTDIEV